MDDNQDLFSYDSLAFFGKVNASISHELKNIMAIISETAGMLNDLTEMAEHGNPIELKVLKSCTDSIAEEIQRGFLTIRQMNRFSHSIDTPIVSVNLMEVLDLVINLCGYLAFAGKIHLRSLAGEAPMVLTCPFVLQTIVYQVLLDSFRNTGPSAEINISIQSKDASTYRIDVSGFSVEEFQRFPEESTQKMAESIGVVIYWDRSADRLALDVPQSHEDFLSQKMHAGSQ